MELTLKINTRNKDSKPFLKYIENLSYIEILKNKSKDKVTFYNIEFVEMVKKSAMEEGKIIDPNNLWDSI
jgi:hypothetical protein